MIFCGFWSLLVCKIIFTCESAFFGFRVKKPTHPQIAMRFEGEAGFWPLLGRDQPLSLKFWGREVIFGSFSAKTRLSPSNWRRGTSPLEGLFEGERLVFGKMVFFGSFLGRKPPLSLKLGSKRAPFLGLLGPFLRERGGFGSKGAPF